MTRRFFFGLRFSFELSSSHGPRWVRRRLLALAALLGLLFSPSERAQAFPHVVQSGETLASLAERFYGRIQMERVLATANALDGPRSGKLTPGQILEIPAVTYRQVHQGETWKSLARELLGDDERYIHLAQINGHKPWIEPETGQLVVVPYNLQWLATGEESLATLAYRFLGSTKHAYTLVVYNDLGEDGAERGQLLLIPLHELTLTAEGQAAAELAASMLTAQGHGDRFRQQQDSRNEEKALFEDIRGGRYISAIARGTRLLSAGKLTQIGRSQAHFALLEAYVAVDARGLARTACESWRSLNPSATLDPLMTSPKILKVCPEAPIRAEPSDEDAQKRSPQPESEGE